MTTNRRPILFEVLGERGSAARRSAARPLDGLSSIRDNAAGLVAVILVVGVIFAGAMYWKFSGRGQKNDGGSAPLLQTNAVGADGGAQQEPAANNGDYALLACSFAFTNERSLKKAREQAEDILGFLDSLPDPDFRDPFAVKVLKEDRKPNEVAGKWCVYVGAARNRKDLEPLREKLVKVEYPRNSKPFKSAYPTKPEKR